jgi:prepilin-type processing-associated H-X9-DG protein
VASFGLGLLALAGAPALLLGLKGLRAVNAGEGRLRGARLAIAGMVLGGLATLITLVGIGALVVVRVQYASMRMTCTNNLRQMGIALTKYGQVQESFPAAASGAAGLDPRRGISWMASVLPLLAEGHSVNQAYQKLAGQIDPTSPWDDPANKTALNTPVRAFLCPGHSDFDPNRPPGLTHYVGMAGVGANAIDLPRTDPKAGMFGFDRGVKQVEITRGLTYTLMVLETAHDNGPWLAPGFPTVRGLAPDVEHYVGEGRPFGGLHTRIMNVLWVDGSVRPVNEDVPGELLRRQATIRSEMK